MYNYRTSWTLSKCKIKPFCSICIACDLFTLYMYMLLAQQISNYVKLSMYQEHETSNIGHRDNKVHKSNGQKLSRNNQRKHCVTISLPAEASIIADLGLQLMFEVSLFLRQLVDSVLTLSDAITQLTALFTAQGLCINNMGLKIN